MIIARLPEHTCYVEPFGGMAAVLLAKPRSKVEVYNDLDQGLANVMRVVKYHPDELAREMRYMLAHRTERLRWLTQERGETDVQRAARWITVRWSGFAGLAGRGFHVAKSAGIISRSKMVDLMMQVSERLAHVQIECLPWQRVLAIYDGPDTCFFLDPPYADGDQKIYDAGTIDHEELRSALRKIKGRWVLTYGDHPTIRQLYEDCHLESVERVRTINNTARKRYVELIIRPRDQRGA